MKKSIVLAAVMVVAAGAAFTGCKEKTNVEQLNSTDSKDYNVEQLNSTDSKDYLVETGKQLLNTFNTADQKAAVDLCNGLYKKYESYNWDDIENQIETDYHSQFEPFFGMPRRMAQVAAGEQLPTATDKTILFSLAAMGRLFEMDDANKTIKITRTNDATARLLFKDADGTQCEVKLWGEGKETEIAYTYEEYSYKDQYDQNGNCTGYERVYEGKRTIKVQAPATIKMYLKQGSNTIISFTFNWDSNLKDYFNESLALQVVNITVSEDAEVSTASAKAAFAVNYGETTLLSGAVSLPKYELIEWSNGGNITEANGEEWIAKYEQRYEYLLGKLGAGETKLNVLDRVHVVGQMTDGAALYDAAVAWDKKYDADDISSRTYTYKYTYETEYGTEYRTGTDEYYPYWERACHTLTAQKEYCSIYDKYLSCALYYGNNEEEKQAELKLQPCEHKDSYEPWEYTNRYNYGYSDFSVNFPINYVTYEVEPVLYFPKDQTTYAFETYFDGKTFNSLVYMAEDLVNKYIDLLDPDFGIGHVKF